MHRKYFIKTIANAESLTKLSEEILEFINGLQEEPTNEGLQIDSVSLANHTNGIHMPGGGFMDVLRWDAMITYSVKDPDHLL